MQRRVIRSSVGSLLRLGPLPQSREAEVELLQQIQAAIEEVPRPVSIDEARALLAMFGPDDCFGLAWAIVSLIEAAPGWPSGVDLSGGDEWTTLLRTRAANAGLLASTRRHPSEFGSPPEEAGAERLRAMAMRWGIGDDIERELAVQNASDAELAELATCLDHVPDRFWEWLAGRESFSPQPSETYVKMSALVAAMDSARVRLSASRPPNHRRPLGGRT